MSVLGWLKAVLGATKEERPPLTLEDVQSLVGEMTKASERARAELVEQAAREAEEETSALEAKVQALQEQLAQQTVERIATLTDLPPEVPKLQCACGATAMRVDVVHESLRFVEGRMQRIPDGATVVCPRCGRGYGLDERGQFDPHRAAWPSAWVVAEGIEERRREIEARVASRGTNGKPLRRASPVADMRRPPV